MPRPKMFDEVEVLDQIAAHFWSHGFHASSLDRLCRATGLTKTSLYNAYGGKEALFKKAVDRYVEQMLGEAMAILRGDGPVRGELRAAMRRFLVEPGPGQVGQGCLLTNSTLELAESDPALHAYVCAQYALVQGVFEAYFEAARARGAITPTISSARLARQAWVLLNGLRVQSRVDADPALMEELIEDALDTFAHLLGVSDS